MISVTDASAARGVFNGDVAEQYHALANWLRTVGDLSPAVPKAIGVTGCMSGAGVSTVALNLATAAAELCDQPVLLLDVSSTECATARRFALSGDLGLAEAVATTGRPGEFARPTPIANLWLLAANQHDDPRTLATACTRMDVLLRSLEQEFGFIVIDMPKAESSLCFIIAALFNGVLLVMESEGTRTSNAARAKQRLVHANANLLGVILNKHRQHIPRWLDKRL